MAVGAAEQQGCASRQLLLQGYESELFTATYHLHATLNLSPFAVEGLSASLQVVFLSPELAEREPALV